jgi:hypothetical protein
MWLVLELRRLVLSAVPQVAPPGNIPRTEGRCPVTVRFSVFLISMPLTADENTGKPSMEPALYIVVQPGATARYCNLRLTNSACLNYIYLTS